MTAEERNLMGFMGDLFSGNATSESDFDRIARNYGYNPSDPTVASFRRSFLKNGLNNGNGSRNTGTNLSSSNGFFNGISTILDSQATQRGTLSQYENVPLSVITQSITKLNGLVDSFKGNIFGGIKSIIGEGATFFKDELVGYLNEEAILRDQINSKLNITGKLSEDIRQDIQMARTETLRYGYGINDVTELFVNLNQETSKFRILSQDILEDAAPVSRAFLESMGEMGRAMASLEKVGIGYENTIRIIEDAGLKSMSLGLNGRKTVADITSNIEKLNEFGFARGAMGLAEMSRKSVELRMNMSEIFKVAEKVFSPEGAIDMVANLQVLGAAVGDLNDPFKLMYMSTNNVEGFADAIGQASQTLSTFNEEQGRFEVTGVNLRIAREMAQQLGVSYDQLTNSAIAAAERSAAAADLLKTGFYIDDDQKEFFTNISRMEGGKMVLTVPESVRKELGIEENKIALSDMTANIMDAFLKYQDEVKTMNAKDVARDQVTILEDMNRQMMSLVALTRMGLANEIERYLKENDAASIIKEFGDTIFNDAHEVTKKALYDQISRMDGQRSNIELRNGEITVVPPNRISSPNTSNRIGDEVYTVQPNRTQYNDAPARETGVIGFNEKVVRMNIQMTANDSQITQAINSPDFTNRTMKVFKDVMDVNGREFA